MLRKILCFLGFHDCEYYTTLSRTKPRRMKMCMYCQKVIKIN
jgi:hypothetical protein